jgi:type IV pilus assembly protein PilA
VARHDGFEHPTVWKKETVEMMIKKLKRGFTLVELMIVVAIIGVLAALAIFGVRKYLTNAKTAEARQNIGRLAKDASAAWAKEGTEPGMIPSGTSSTESTNRLCESATPVPGTLDKVANKKYQSKASDWGGSQHEGWTCLKFQVNEPQYYMYHYNATASAFTAMAQGDLDGDNTPSEFKLMGEVDDGVVKLSPNIAEEQPEE